MYLILAYDVFLFFWVVYVKGRHYALCLVVLCV